MHIKNPINIQVSSLTIQHQISIHSTILQET